MMLSYKAIDKIVWFIPIRKTRDFVRNYLLKKLYNKLPKKIATSDVRDIYFLSDLRYNYYPDFQELNEGNKLYSYAYCLKEYAGFDPKYVLKAAVEHGIRAHELGLEGLPEVKSLLPTYFTSGGLLGEKYINKVCNKKVYSVGPYIHYAREYLSEEKKKKEKKRLGKNLLLIPTHSCAFDTIAKYDTNDLIKEVNRIVKDFDSVRVCLYWSDVMMGLDKVYEEAGFECVTAGHAYDIHFLSRLKSIIDLSDLVMDNSMGTPMTFSIYMKKPFYYFNQESIGTTNVDGKKSIIKYSEQYQKSKYIPLFINAFSKYSETITKEQYDLVDKYCGLSSIKSKSELIEIFNETEELYKQMMDDYENKYKYI